MKLDIYNLTDRSLLCHWNSKFPQEHHILLPNQLTNVETPSRSSMVTLTAHQSMSQRGEKDEIWLSTTSFSFKRRMRALWMVIEADESAPWTIYRCKVSWRWWPIWHATDREMAIPGFQKAPKAAHSPQEGPTFVFVRTFRLCTLVFALSSR